MNMQQESKSTSGPGKSQAVDAIDDDIGDKKKGEVQYDLNSDEEQEYVSSYKPIRDKVLCWKEIQVTGTFALKRYKDSMYRGQLDPHNHKRQGKGVIIYNSGRIYEGSWMNDKRQGAGYEYFTNGNTYEGEYKKGKVWG